MEWFRAAPVLRRHSFPSLGAPRPQLTSASPGASMFDASGLASGVYLYRFQAGDHAQSRMMVVVK